SERRGESDGAAVDAGERPEPKRAGRAEGGEQRSLRSDRDVGFAIIQALEARAKSRIVGPALHRECTLARGGRHYLGIEDFALVDCDTEPSQTCKRQDRAVVLALTHFAKSGVDV